jgi:hypothetical protein
VLLHPSVMERFTRPTRARQGAGGRAGLPGRRRGADLRRAGLTALALLVVTTAVEANLGTYRKDGEEHGSWAAASAQRAFRVHRVHEYYQVTEREIAEAR